MKAYMLIFIIGTLLLSLVRAQDIPIDSKYFSDLCANQTQLNSKTNQTNTECVIQNLNISNITTSIILNITGYNITFENTQLTYNILYETQGQKPSFFIYGEKNELANKTDYPNISITKGSNLRFQIIYLQTHGYINLTIDSSLNASGTGHVQGPGFFIDDSGVIQAASYAGQGGYLNNPTMNFYGNFSDKFEISYVDLNKYVANSTDLNETFQNFLGSGGAVNNNAIKENKGKANGGGAIILRGNIYNLKGHIDAKGYPLDSTIYAPYNTAGGSGGYIVIDEYYIQTQNNSDQSKSKQNLKLSYFGSILDVSGGQGQSQNVVGSGSGGRIVIQIPEEQSLPNPAVLDGGKYNDSSQQNLFGAAGTIFFQNKLSLNTYSLQQTGCITFVDLKKPIQYINSDGEQKSGQLENLNIGIDELLYSNISPLYDSITNSATINVANIYVGTNQILTYFSNQTSNMKLISINCSNLNVSQGIITLPFQSGSSTDNLLIEQIIINVTTLSMKGGKIQTQFSLKTSINASSSIIMNQNPLINAGQYLNITSTYAYLGEVSTEISSDLIKNLSDTTFTYTNININNSSNNFSLILSQGGSIKSDFLNIASTGNVQINGRIFPSNKDFYQCNKEGPKLVQSFIYSSANKDAQLNSQQLVQNINIHNNLTGDETADFSNLQKYLKNDFSLSIVAFALLEISPEASIIASRVGMYSYTIEIYPGATIDTSGKGCQSGQGRGKGNYFTDDCSGGGASHAGNGGLAQSSNKTKTPTCPIAMSYGQYDSMKISEGSGGGSSSNATQQYGGAGGGYVYIQATVMTHNGSIKSEGTNSTDIGQPIQSGGGSGGSIFIMTYYLYGYGNFSIQGGSSKYSVSDGNGGAGSGGRLKLLRFNWSDQKYFIPPGANSTWQYDNKTMNFTIQNQAGVSDINDGRVGSIWSTPCPPGYAGNNCHPCLKGQYSSDIFAYQCTNCSNMPQQVVVRNSGKYSIKGNDFNTEQTDQCYYSCSQLLTKVENNPNCLSNLKLSVENLGGSEVVIILGIAIVLVIVFSIVFMVFKINRKSLSIESQIDKCQKLASGINVDDQKENGSSQAQQNQGYLNITYKLNNMNLSFFDRDICQHFSRIYLLGNNSFSQPWQLPKNMPNRLRQKVILERYSWFVEQINREMEWSNREAQCHKIIKYLYPAFLPSYINWRRTTKCSKFLDLIEEKYQEANFWKSEEERNRGYNIMKFSFSNQISNGTIDFLDQRLTYESFEGPSLPLTLFLKGSGKYQNPFQLDYENDPIVKSIGFTLNNQKLWKKITQNLNSKLWALQINSFNREFKMCLFDVLSYIKLINEQIMIPERVMMVMWLEELVIIDNSNSYDIDWRNPSELSDYLPSKKLETQEYQYKLDLDYIKKKPQYFNNFISYWKKMSIFNKKNQYRIAIVFKKTKQFQSDEQDKISIVNKHDSNDGSFKRENEQNNLERNYPFGHENTEELQMEDDVEIQWLNGFAREGQIDTQWLKEFKNIQKYEPTFKGHLYFWYQNTIQFIMSVVQTVSYRNKSKLDRFNVISMVIYILLCIIDVTLTVMIMVSLIESNNTNSNTNYSPFLQTCGFYLFFLFYPFVPILSMYYNVRALLSCKVNRYQQQAYFVSFSLYFNTMGFFLSTLNQEKYYIQLNFQSGLQIIVAKILLSQFIQFQIAYQNNPKYLKNQEYMKKHFQKVEAKVKAHSKDYIVAAQDQLQDPNTLKNSIMIESQATDAISQHNRVIMDTWHSREGSIYSTGNDYFDNGQENDNITYNYTGTENLVTSKQSMWQGENNGFMGKIKKKFKKNK